MAVLYTDGEIASLLGERKLMPANWSRRTRLRQKTGHEEASVDLRGDAGNDFRVILRRSGGNPFDFSVILALRVPRSNRMFRLRRYNGNSHEHTNHIEGNTFDGFHIHMATERYQDYGTREDAYAEPTDRYHDLRGAIQRLIDDANFCIPSDGRPNLFEER